jgi:CRISPR/Cas system CMR subunit Cmr4 (Cas7 group RAMP superfamily)
VDYTFQLCNIKRLGQVRIGAGLAGEIIDIGIGREKHNGYLLKTLVGLDLAGGLYAPDVRDAAIHEDNIGRNFGDAVYYTVAGVAGVYLVSAAAEDHAAELKDVGVIVEE